MTNYLEPTPDPFRPPKGIDWHQLNELDELKKKHTNHDWGEPELDEKIINDKEEI